MTVDLEKPIRLNETFVSPQGEGKFAGVPTLFIRFYGCNLDCSWCDQPNALITRPRTSSYELSIGEVVDLIMAHPLEVPVCFTGGEPFFQPAELLSTIRALREDEGFKRVITIETNGTIYHPGLIPASVFLSISPKTSLLSMDGSATMHGEDALRDWMLSGAMGGGMGGMQFKFVVENEAHFKAIAGWLDTFVPEQCRRYIPVYFQPEWFHGRNDFTALVKSLMSGERLSQLWKMGYETIRFVPQVHKALHVR